MEILILVVFVSLLLLYWCRRHLGKGCSDDLRGKTVFITGCDSGFGFSLAFHCAEIGMKVVAGCFETDSEGRRHLESVENITVVSLDVRSEASVGAAVEVVTRLAGSQGLTALVNNAAVLVFGETMWQTEEQVRSQMEVNYLGPLRVSRACLPLLVAGKGRIVNVISNCTECPLPTLGPYTASKAALLALSDAMRPELARTGVKVVIVNPGDAPRDTPLTAGQEPHYRAMEAGLAPSETQIHGQMFRRARDYYTKLFPGPGPRLVKLDNPGYYRTMEEVMGCPSPRAYYSNSPLVTNIVFTLVSMMPRYLSDTMRMKMMRVYE